MFCFLSVIFRDGLLFGKESEAGTRRRLRREKADASADLEPEKELPESEIQ